MTLKEEKPAGNARTQSNKLRKRGSSKKKSSKKIKTPRKTEGKQKERKVAKSAYREAWEEISHQLLNQVRNHWIATAVITCISLLLCALYFAVDTMDTQVTPPVTDKVRLDFSRNGTKLGPVEFGLFGSVCPLTTRNFIRLATHKNGHGYRGSKLHLVSRDHIIAGGDMIYGNGTGGRSAMNEPFERESFHVRHTGPGYLGMIMLKNNSDSSRTSIFYVTLIDIPAFDHVHVIFGMVLSGMKVLKKIEEAEVDDRWVPKEDIIISDSGYSQW